MQCFTYLCFQQRGTRSQPKQILFFTCFCQRTSHWTLCYQKREPVWLVQIWWCSAIGYYEFSWSATSLDSFLKAFKTSKTNGFIPYEGFDHPDKKQKTVLPPYDAFHSKLRSCNPLEIDYTDDFNLLKSELTTKQAVIKLKLWNRSPTGIEFYKYLQQIWKREKMSSFKDFLRWSNKKDIVPTLEAMQKLIASYRDMVIDMLKLACSLPNLANICLHKSADAKFNPFTEEDEDLLGKVWQKVVGPFVVFTRKAVVDETIIRKSTNRCKSVVGIEASQIYSYPMSQPMPTGPYMQWDIDSVTKRFIPLLNKTRSFENMVMSYFQRTRPDCQIESFCTTSRRKKIDRFSVGRFCSHCTTMFDAKGCFYHFCHCQELHPSLITEEGIKRGSKKRELDELRRGYVQQKGFTVIEMLECGWWRLQDNH